MSSVTDRLGPGWVDTVPPMFRSAAASVEDHRRRLVGDPAALRATARAWQGEADVADAVWQSVEDAGRTYGGDWEGAAATAFHDRATRLAGEVSATATSLRYGATGLELAATGLAAALEAANRVVVEYASRLRALYSTALGVTGPGRPSAVASMMREGTALGGQALQEVYAQEVRLDALLASLPRRFVLGPASPWRQGIQSTVDVSRFDTYGGAVTAQGLRVTRREGMYVSRLIDGQSQVMLTDAYFLGPHVSAGTKLSYDRLPQRVRDMLRRTYGEAEAAGMAGYALRYRFRTAAEADRFVDRLQGVTPWERAGTALRDAVGLYAGPLADFGPWHDALAGRKPDEIAVTLGITGKVSGDVGGQPLLAGQATGGAEADGTVVLAADGTTTVSARVAGNVKVGGTVALWTEVAGVAGESVERTTYDRSGEPVRYTVQEFRTEGYDYHAGTNNSYVGAAGKAVPGGAHLKVDVEGSDRHISTYSLDLTDPPNRRLYDQAMAALAVPPDERVPQDDAALRDIARRIREHGVLTVHDYEVQRGSGELSATVGVGSGTFGVKLGPNSEHQDLVDARYRGIPDPAVPDREPELRPVPRDPRRLDRGPVDVLDQSSPTG